LEKPTEVIALKSKLEDLWNKTARPGACDRAAEHVIEMANFRTRAAA